MFYGTFRRQAEWISGGAMHRASNQTELNNRNEVTIHTLLHLKCIRLLSVRSSHTSHLKCTKLVSVHLNLPCNIVVRIEVTEP